MRAWHKLMLVPFVLVLLFLTWRNACIKSDVRTGTNATADFGPPVKVYALFTAYAHMLSTPNWDLGPHFPHYACTFAGNMPLFEKLCYAIGLCLGGAMIWLANGQIHAAETAAAEREWRKSVMAAKWRK